MPCQMNKLLNSFEYSIILTCTAGLSSRALQTVPSSHMHFVVLHPENELFEKDRQCRYEDKHIAVHVDKKKNEMKR